MYVLKIRLYYFCPEIYMCTIHLIFCKISLAITLGSKYVIGMFGVAGVVPEPTSQVEAAGEDGSSATGDQRVPPECQHPGPYGGDLLGATGGPLAGTPSAERPAGVPSAPSDRLPQLPHTAAHRTSRRTSQAADPVARHLARPAVLLHRRPQAQGQGARRVHHEGTADGVNRVDFHKGLAGRTDSGSVSRRRAIMNTNLHEQPV